jgi:hypothetical protein
LGIISILGPCRERIDHPSHCPFRFGDWNDIKTLVEKNEMEEL